MDELKIRTDFMKGIISRVIRKILRKKLGEEISIIIDDIDLVVGNEVTRIHIDVKATAPNSVVKKLIFEKAGL